MLDGISFPRLATEQGEREQRPQRPRRAPSLDERAKLRPPTSYDEEEVIVARAPQEQKRNARKGEIDPGPPSHSILGRCQVLNNTTRRPVVHYCIYGFK